MRILLIKTSSMGDVIHVLPALTDAGNAFKDIQFDWVVEDSFAEIPHWHPRVNKVIPIALRRWRKGIFSSKTRVEWKQLRQQLLESQYDFILDAQGLVKSAFLCYFAQGLRVGLDFRSARESLASFVYQRKYPVNFYQHAIVRMRSLFSQALHYSLPKTAPDFGLAKNAFNQVKAPEQYVVFLHGTTWESKQWPEEYWKRLADLAVKAGYRVKMAGGNPAELARATRIAKYSQGVDATGRLTIGQMAHLLANAQGAIAVDTGFGHLAAALNLPTVSIYGSTNPKYTGAIGNRSIFLTPSSFSCSPCLKRQCTYRGPATVSPACYATIPPQRVWDVLAEML